MPRLEGFAGLLALALTACSAGTRSGPDLEALLAAEPKPVLSAYGLFSDARAEVPASGVVEYDLINPLFTDHAMKQRYIYVPKGKAAQYVAHDVFTFPVGTAIVKTFSYAPDLRAPETDAYKVETRLLIHKAGGWVAYPYVWNEAGTEAVYTPAGAAREIAFTAPDGAREAITYQVPNRNQCKTCHQAGDAIEPIGPKARQLDHAGPNGAPQLADWTRRGLLTGVSDAHVTLTSASDANASLENRGRAYLDSQCGHCHKADGSASNTGLWLEATEADAVKLGIGKHPVAAGRGAGDRRLVIAPGDPDASILTYRMASTEPGVAMPELGRQLADAEGVKLMTAWIASLDAE